MTFDDESEIDELLDFGVISPKLLIDTAAL